MEVIEGTVRKAKHTVEVNGTENRTVTEHVASFQLGSVPIRLKLPDSILIDDGDRVSVAGQRRRGTLQAFAYYNHTSGAEGTGSVWSPWILGSVFTIVGLVLCAYVFGALLTRNFDLFAVGIGGLLGAAFLAVGLTSIKAGARARRAAAALKSPA